MRKRVNEDGGLTARGKLQIHSGFPEPLPTRWFQRVLPQQPQKDDLIDRESSVRDGQPGKRSAPLEPWDGPAIDIRLTAEPMQCQRVNGSYLNIGVWRGLPIRSGQIVKFGATSDAGFASLCRKVGDCERAESGTIVFERFQDGSGASGRYELHFKGGEDMNAVFDAKWCESHSICR